MQVSALVPYGNTAGALNFVERWISSAKVILTGFLVVFAVLLLLIGIIKLFSAIVGKAQRTNQMVREKNKKHVDMPKEASVPVVSEKAEPDAESEEIPEEVIAVISAAVAVMYGGKEKVKIKSVKKSAHSRSAWANAGVIENTRPF